MSVPVNLSISAITKGMCSCVNMEPSSTLALINDMCVFVNLPGVIATTTLIKHIYVHRDCMCVLHLLE